MRFSTSLSGSGESTCLHRGQRQSIMNYTDVFGEHNPKITERSSPENDKTSTDTNPDGYR